MVYLFESILAADENAAGGGVGGSAQESSSKRDRLKPCQNEKEEEEDGEENQYPRSMDQTQTYVDPMASLLPVSTPGDEELNDETEESTQRTTALFSGDETEESTQRTTALFSGDETEESTQRTTALFSGDETEESVGEEEGPQQKPLPRSGVSPVATATVDSGGGNTMNSPTSDESTGIQLSVEQRHAVRLLMYASIPAEALRDTFDGLLCPPPYALTDLSEDFPSLSSSLSSSGTSSSSSVSSSSTAMVGTLRQRKLIEEAAAVITTELRALVVAMPLNLAVKSGVYDARLRAATRRLSQLFSVPFVVVLERENEICLLEENDADDEAAKKADQGKKKQSVWKRINPKRVATVGAFAGLGAVLLVVTAGIAAPAIAPAFAAVLGSATAISGATAGTAAFASVFTGILGSVASHAAAVGTLMTPILTTANLSAIFGAGGASLAGWKAVKRTGGVEDMRIRSRSELSELPALTGMSESLAFTDRSLIYGIEQSDKIGYVVPQHRRSISQPNVEREAKKYNRTLVTAIDNLSGFPLKMCCAGIGEGRWMLAPPGQIPDSHSAIFVTRNAHIIPRGSEALCCYAIVSPDQAPFYLWFYLCRTLTGGQKIRVLGTAKGKDEFSLLSALQQAAKTQQEIEQLSAQRKKARSSTSHTTQEELEEMQEDEEGEQGDSSSSNEDEEKKKKKDEESVATPQGRFRAKLRSMVRCMFEHLNSTEVPFSHLLDCKDSPYVIEVREHPSPVFTVRLRNTPPRAIPTEMLQGHVKDLQTKTNMRRQLYVVVDSKLQEPDECGSPASSPQQSERVVLLQKHKITQGRAIASTSIAEELLPGHGMVFGVSNNDLVGGCHMMLQFGIEDHRIGPHDPHPADLSCRGSSSSPPTPPSGSGNTPRQRRSRSPSLRRPERHIVNICVDTTTVGKFSCGVSYDSEEPKLVSDPTTGTARSELTRTKIVWQIIKEANIIRITLLDDFKKEELVVGGTKNRASEHKMSITIGICGFSTVFDPRYPLTDQQLALWNPIFKRNYAEHSECYAVDWENDYLMQFAELVGVDVHGKVVSVAEQQAARTLKKTAEAVRDNVAGSTFAAMRAAETFASTLALPLIAIQMTKAIDNSLSVLKNRAEDAGEQLADALKSELRGNRPVTLVGFSFGASVVAHCLVALEREGLTGLVEDAILLGAPLEVRSEMWMAMRRCTAGRLVNVYNRSDWVLKALHRALNWSFRPLAGLHRISGVPGVENVDASALVASHADYGLELQGILDAIPPYPTHRTLSQQGAVSPGVLVRWHLADATSKRMLESVASKHSFVFAIVNDSPTSSRSLRYVCSKLYECVWDFEVPTVHGGRRSDGNAGDCGDGDCDDGSSDDQSGAHAETQGVAVGVEIPGHSSLIVSVTTSLVKKVAPTTTSEKMSGRVKGLFESTPTMGGILLFDVLDGDDHHIGSSLVVLFSGRGKNSKLDVTSVLRPPLLEEDERRGDYLGELYGGFAGVDEFVARCHPTNSALVTSTLRGKIEGDVNSSSVLCTADRIAFVTVVHQGAWEKMAQETLDDDDECRPVTPRLRREQALFALASIFEEAPVLPIEQLEELVANAERTVSLREKQVALPSHMVLGLVVVFNGTKHTVEYSGVADTENVECQAMRWILYPPRTIPPSQAAAVILCHTLPAATVETTTKEPKSDLGENGDDDVAVSTSLRYISRGQQLQQEYHVVLTSKWNQEKRRLDHVEGQEQEHAQGCPHRSTVEMRASVDEQLSGQNTQVTPKRVHGQNTQFMLLR